MTTLADAIAHGCRRSACVLPATKRKMRHVNAPHPKVTRVRPSPPDGDQRHTCCGQRQPDMKAHHRQSPAEAEQADRQAKVSRRDRWDAQPLGAGGEHEPGDEQRHCAQAEPQPVRRRGGYLPRPYRTQRHGDQMGRPPRCSPGPVHAGPEETQAVGRVQQARRAPKLGRARGIGWHG